MNPTIFRIFVQFSVVLALQLTHLQAQEKHKYFEPTDALVKQRIAQWQDMKFGLLMHWGPYSQWGIVESWSICAEDEDWCRRSNPNYSDYKRAYEALGTTFNPVRFNPEKWAEAASKAGMKYLVFTTKHHDGFCMFDTKLTDYKITSDWCPFHVNPRANVTKEVFNAFREKGLWAGAYFSKPDWHCPDYWWPNFATPDRNVNYDIKTYPDRWENYVKFTHGQIEELVRDYGPLNILWFDGGWVQKLTEAEVTKYKMEQLRPKQNFQSQDIRMDEIASMARKYQPGIIVVDRAVEGPNQNYLTPENTVPESYLDYPWESCIIAGGGWSWAPNAKFMSGHKAIHTLADVVAKGGNLLLNIAPGPDGDWDPQAYALLNEIGDWLSLNGEAIYETRAQKPYKQGQCGYTKGKDGSVYAIYFAKEDETALPARMMLNEYFPKPGAEITLMGSHVNLKYKVSGDGCVVDIPANLRKPYCKHAWVLRIVEK